ncbi:MAG: tRNA (5-methylaminomethyl-2-thiouridine)(34)-methyltransferase MnmD [Saprospiraceae bacterium]|nr:tRNA (5-methylaminomethyl-2-thiouridine)(34)-methyltransferase MnmD [Saprospiraceae bacterium]
MHETHVIRISDDGSHTVISPDFNVSYHSVHGAINESNVVFLQAGLDYLLDKDYPSISVFELGFGTGLNALLSYKWAQSHNKPLVYHTVEAYPLDETIYSQLNYGQILDDQEMFEKLQGCAWEVPISLGENFRFCKYKQDIELIEIADKYNVIFFDAFSPASQPHLWEIPVLGKMFDSLMPGGILVSYCAQGAFKRNLKAVGFKIEALPGPRGKREMTRAVKI